VRQLYYTNYQSGQAGLSNGIMSVECGVVLAFLTKRFLLLDGNVSPPANIVSYGDRVDNSSPSRITDLVNIPIPWGEPDEQDLQGIVSRELTEYSLMDSVFYVPGTVDILSADARDFARGRSQWLCEDEQLLDVPLLRVSEEPMAPNSEHHRNNLSFYSYLFYLDDETRKAVYQLLSRMQAREPYAKLAARVAADLGDFNAVHLRRGDFKVTYGVTVLDRSPWEAIDAMDHHFSRTEKLVICTDERGDPFFEEIKTAWPDHVFIDHHILDHYGAEFASLPKNDSLALAYLSQLVAAESKDFIGSMTSTYTAMIQRLRGNRGKLEPFKFLWNELPEPGDRLERGSHPISECVPLENGIMIPECDGAYSWSRYSKLLNPAWMREWPESFLTEQVLATGRLTSAVASAPQVAASGTKPVQALISFAGMRVKIKSKVPSLAATLVSMLHNEGQDRNSNVIAEIDVDSQWGVYLIKSGGSTVAEVGSEREVPRAILTYLAPILLAARKNHTWFDGMVVRLADKVVLIVGDWRSSGTHSLTGSLCHRGWELLGDEVIPVRQDDCMVIPFARCARLYDDSAAQQVVESKLDAVVYSSRRLHNRGALFSISPSAAVAELTRSSLDFPVDRQASIKRLCQLVEQVPAYQLNYSKEQEAAKMMSQLAEQETAHPPRSAKG